MYHTYILKSVKDQGYYFGHCANLDKHLQQPNKGRVKRTKSRLPFIVHYYESYTSKSAAFRRENFFKSFEGRKWLLFNNIIE